MTAHQPRLAAAAFEVLPSEAAVLDSEGMILLVNDAWRRFGRENGAGAGCGVGVNYLQVCERAAAAGDEIAGVVGSALAAVLAGGAPNAELDYPCHSPTAQRWFHLQARALPTQRRLLVLHHEVSEQLRETVQLRHQATHDRLTGLPNRALLQDRLRAALRPCDRRHQVDVTVLVLDLDSFKKVNDRYGHLAGDAILTAVAQRLRSELRTGDTVARWGGDEFVVVLPNCPTAYGLYMLRRISETVATPLPLDKREVAVTASIGLSVGRPGEQPADLLRRADRAMRAAKRDRMPVADC